MKKRTIFKKIWQNIDSKKILLLNGARQVGKTSLLKMIKNKLIKDKNIKEKDIFWFDLEKIEDLSLWSKQSFVLNKLPVNKEGKYYIFIDEFQKLRNIGSTLKVLHDHYSNFKIIVTGSASWYLNIDESMAGRKEVMSIYPLSFKEYLEWQEDGKINNHYGLAQKDTKSTPQALLEIINYSLIDFLTYGGYPEVILSKDYNKKDKILSEIINSYILRDMQLQNYAANSLQIKKILTLLADRVGGILDIASLSIDSSLGRNLLENRLDLLQETFVLHLALPYFTNKTKELVKNKKIFLVDSGLRANLMKDYKLIPKTVEFGQITENFVVTELLKRGHLLDQYYYWRTKTKQEVDIVIKREKELIPIEVKGGNIKKTPYSLKAFIKEYKPKQAYILNWSTIYEEEFEGCRIYFRPLWWAENI